MVSLGLNILGLVKKKDINTFIQHGCSKLLKSDSKDVYNVTNVFHINAVLLNFLFNKNHEINVLFTYKKNCMKHVFNIANKKCFLSIKSALEPDR